MTHFAPIIVLAVIVGLLPLIWILGTIAGFFEARTRQAKQTVVAEYEAPSRLSAAELGFIVDKTFGHNELLATVAQLYAKGAVILAPLSKEDFSIVPLPDSVTIDASLDDNESGVLGYIRGQAQSGESLRWSQLDTLSGELAGVQADFEATTLEGLVNKGLLYPNVFQSLTKRRRLPAIGFALLVCISLFLIFLHFTKENTGTSAGFQSVDHEVTLLALLLPVLITGLLCYLYANFLAFVYYRRAGQPVTATSGLQLLWADVAGFQIFLKETEYVRLQSVCDPKDASMAYCLALGLDPGFIDSLRSKPI